MKRIARSIIIIARIIASYPLDGDAASKLSVYVSILPQKYFVQQICKDLADVQVMVPPGASPATYEPKPRQMAAISKARIYFSY